ncbi:hypothetical protein GCM10007423_64060 [Dyadobacter endophyticus]|uniref:DUF3575 domain-containing protein n=1 Tax=Dyadobacter endophyticus TaxID=1749036 RepID=A0ABQ1ZDS4_9BACT|nr:hypothetical protein [Dyadobacter endophyticus]GGH55960.1 hypothetical protein GCM10007423_64060 [Dyadobacter endophyticus]
MYPVVTFIQIPKNNIYEILIAFFLDFGRKSFSLYKKLFYPMKKISTILILFLVCTVSFGQTKNITDGYHVFNMAISLPEVDQFGVALAAGNKEMMLPNEQFKVFGVHPNLPAATTDYIITINRYIKDPGLRNLLVVFDNNNNQRYFRITVAEYQAYCERLEKRGNFHVITSSTLVKIRPGSKEPRNGIMKYSEFGNDFNLGALAGWSVKPNRKKTFVYSFMGGISFTTIKATPETTQYMTEATDTKPSELVSYLKDEESNQSCFTLSGGPILEIDKFQISAIIGWDFMQGAVGRKWIYRNRPWIGIGFGYQVFRVDDKKPTQQP